MSNNIRRKLEWRTSRVARLSVVLVACALFSAIVGCGIRIQPPATKIQLTQKRAAEIHAEFDAFIASVAAEDYRRLRSTIVALPGYNPYSTDLETIEALVENGSRDEAKDLLEASFPNLLLSPQAHLLASQIARADGDEELAAIEGLYAVICLEGILRSGDGNSSQPYLVTRPSDEYDLLVYLDKRVTGQRLKQQGDRQFELLVLDDGSEIWFDVSVAFGTN
jgi:hypothetical protein